MKAKPADLAAMDNLALKARLAHPDLPAHRAAPAIPAHKVRSFFRSLNLGLGRPGPQGERGVCPKYCALDGGVFFEDGTRR